MAIGKKGFILYADLQQTVKHLSNEQAGILFKHLLSYVNDEEPETDDVIINLAFEPIKQQLKRDLKHWESVREKRSKAGKLSAEKRKQNSTKSTSVKSVEQNLTKSTVIDNVTVNVTDTVKVNDKKEVYIVSIPNGMTLNENEFIAKSFWELFKKNLLESGISKTSNLDKAKLNDWSNQIRLMIEKDERTIEELRSVWNFLDKNEFWKLNIQSIKKLREKFERLYQEARKTTKTDIKKRLGVSEEYLQELQNRINGNK